MANPEHLAILQQGVEAWDAWRQESEERPDLSGADLSGADLSEADLSEADLSRADLSGAYLYGAKLSGAKLAEANLREANLFAVDLPEADLSRADLSGANLTGANLSRANLYKADLFWTNLHKANLTGANLTGAIPSGADLSEANLYKADLSEATLSGAGLSRADLWGTNLTGANLYNADLSEANLTGADLCRANLYKADLSEANLTGANLTGARLERATLVGTILHRAELRNCQIFAISVWRVHLEGAIQKDLTITEKSEPTITVDNLEVAQFIHLLLHNQKIRQVIGTITSKVVLILGRFTPERKAVLDRLRDELRTRDFLPVLFDFEGPDRRDVTETVSTLAHMARFVVADLTDPRSIPQELQKIVPGLPSLPVQPILLEGQEPWGMFPHFERYPWVLPPYRYTSLEQLMEALSEHVIAPAVRKAEELQAVPPAPR